MNNVTHESTVIQYWKNPEFVLAFIRVSTFFALALVVNYFAVRYATLNAGVPVSDRILGAFPLYDTSYIDYQLSLYMEYGVFLFALAQTKRLLFFINATSLLIVVRAFFINLTQLGIPEGAKPTLSFFTQGGDLFFSGHTALPFLAALVFWEIKPARYIFLLLSFLMGTEVLLGHQHYSIDVFAAPFITYGVYSLLKRFS